MNYRNIIINFLILLASLSKAQEQKHSDQLNESIIKNYLANHELKAFKDSIDLEKFLTLLTKSIYQVNNFLQMAILRNLVPKELNIWHQFEEVELNLETTTLIKKKLFEIYSEFGPEFLNDIFLTILKFAVQELTGTKVLYQCAILKIFLTIFKDFIQENDIPATYFQGAIDKFKSFIE